MTIERQKPNISANEELVRLRATNADPVYSGFSQAQVTKPHSSAPPEAVE
jgi:hypothetical protein